MMLVRGRVVYFGAGGAAAVEYVRGLPLANCTSPYQPWLSEVVRRCWLHVDITSAVENDLVEVGRAPEPAAWQRPQMLGSHVTLRAAHRHHQTAPAPLLPVSG